MKFKEIFTSRSTSHVPVLSQSFIAQSQNSLLSTMRRLAISAQEFGKMLGSCCPPGGWGDVIAVAHSGGPDSTCLLYLLHRWLAEKGSTPAGPSKLLSLSVDHSLQPGSTVTAERCRQFSQSLGVPHVMLCIPWARRPYPDLPDRGRPFESVARSARYQLMLEVMQKTGTKVIAMGHHADDHVETLLMRLARKGPETGPMPMGIRRCRRWGMGANPDGLDWAGVPGLHHWIVRPLLGVSKSRILATCELHGLSYMNDPTNLQPSLTPRNYVRNFLSRSEPADETSHSEEHSGLAMNDLKRSVRRLDAIAAELPGTSEEATLPGRLRAAALHLGRLRDKTDEEVDQYLGQFVKPSPPSTLLLYPPFGGLLPSENIRRAIVLRILRFISPRPWGAPISEASRRTTSLDLISTRLWDLHFRKTFCAGSEVIWRSVSLRTDGSIRFINDERESPSTRGWVASRQPPIKHTGALSPCLRDISRYLRPRGTVGQFLWDNRFLLHFRPHLLPRAVLDSCQSPGSVVIASHGQWLLPKIIWLQEGQQQMLLGGVGLEVPVSHGVNPEWVDLHWIRPLDAI